MSKHEPRPLRVSHKDSEETYRSAFEHAAVGLGLLNAEGEWLLVNRGLRELTGCRNAREAKLRFRLPRAFLAPVVSGEVESNSVEEVLRVEGGQRAVLQIMVSRTSPADDGSVRIVAVVRDVTSQRDLLQRLSESELRYRTLVETTGTGFVVVDDQGRVVDANDDYVKLTGRRSLEDILGHRVTEWTAPWDVERNAAEVLQCIRTGYVRNLLIDYIDSEGRATPIGINATVVETEDGIRILGLCRDVSDRRATERTLRRQTERLRTLHEVDQAILAAQSPEMVAEAALGRLAEEIQCRRISVCLFDESLAEGTMLYVIDKEGTVRPSGARVTLEGDLPHGGRLRNLKVLRLPNLEEVADTSPSARALVADGLRSIIAIPLVSEGRLMGALNLSYTEVNAYTEEDIEMAAEVAPPLAIAISQTRLVQMHEDRRSRDDEAVKARARQQAGLAELGQKALSGLGIHSLFDFAVAMAARMLRADCCMITERRAEGGFVLKGSVGWDLRPGDIIPIDPHAEHCLQSSDAVVMGSLTSGVEFPIAPLLEESGIAAGVTVALPCRSGDYGVLSVHSRAPRSFGADDIHFLQAVANTLAMAMERAEAEAEREQLLGELRGGRERLEAVIRQMPAGVIIVDADTRRLIMGNAELERIWGRRFAVGADIFDLLAGSGTRLDGRPYAADQWPIARSILKGEVVDGEEVEILREDTSRETVLMSSSPIRNREGLIVAAVGIMRNITGERQAETHRRTLEEQLLQAQKLESIGRLAGGVAHDFNNLLTAIIGYSQLLAAKLDEGDARSRDVDEIMKAGQRAAGLTSQLLAFSRRQRLEAKSVCLNETINNLVKMISRIIGEDIEVEVLTDPDLPLVLADPTQIEQVLLNLAVNSRDAMSKGGRLVFETRHVELDDNYCREHLWARPGRYAQISVSDTGDGMDAQTMQSIFEPFFTTKEQGKGTGLGLAVVYGIIKQHDGLIYVYSKPETGTTFKIYLPICEDLVVAPDEVETPLPLNAGQETLLVAEDEETLQRLVETILGQLGYRVLMARNGQEAIQLFERHRDEVDMVILDLIMPQVGGRTVYEWLRTTGNDTPVLFMTGYSAEVAQSRGIDGIEAPLLQKPYTAAELGRKVREVLDASARKSGTPSS